MAWQLFRYRPGRFSLNLAIWTGVHGSALLFGWLFGQVFARLSGEDARNPWPAVAAYAGLAVGRTGLMLVGDRSWIRHWNEQALQLRRNLLRWLLEAPRSRVLPSSPGEAVSTFRDDVEELLEYMENWIDSGGLVLFAVGSVVVMASIDPSLTMFTLAPVLATVVLTQALGPQIRKRRRAARAATETVTGFIGETFSAVQTIKLHHAEHHILDEFARINRIRQRAALADTALTEVLRSVDRNMATVATAIVLLAGAGEVRSGALGVGELTVFLVYLPRLTDYMGFLGEILTQHRRTGVSYERIRKLAVDAPDDSLLNRTRVPLDRLPDRPSRAATPGERLDVMSVEGLTHRRPDGAVGLDEVSFEVRRGEFVVVTGRIGSGKSTLVRSLLGLLPAEGEIRWNGELVEDPAWFFVPPRSGYTAQVPRLFSETLEDNIALGRRVAREHLREAVELAVLDADLERLEQGMDTMVGARGVKLSGGQVQRSAAARMFATSAELLVFDDLSSALDLHTEAELWERLFARRDVTCLVVSHRRPALRRADRILLMEAGSIVDSGTLYELLERSPLMAELWADQD
jgi:ATP-binding cassette subfamily B protein/ATP-binding cassette subfamily C protein